jgi:hypothetical protein
MSGDLAKFRAANASKRLTGRSTYEDIDRCIEFPQLEIFGESLRWQESDVTGSSILCIPGMEVEPVGSRSIRINLDATGNLKSGCPKTKRQATAAREQIQNSSLFPSCDPCDFLSDYVVRFHHGFCLINNLLPDLSAPSDDRRSHQMQGSSTSISLFH